MDVTYCSYPTRLLPLSARSCVLLANDWGGAIAWVFAARYPHLVSAMVNMAGPHPVLFEKNASLTQLARSYYMFVFQAPLLPELWLGSFDTRVALSFSEGYMKVRGGGRGGEPRAFPSVPPARSLFRSFLRVKSVYLHQLVCSPITSPQPHMSYLFLWTAVPPGGCCE